MKFFTFFIITTLFFSCANKKKTNEATELVEVPKEEIIAPSDMIKKGFVKAFVQDFSKEDGCGFLIVLEESKQILQPMKPLAELMSKNKLTIWLKYRPIRPIAPTCKKGTPINTEDIKIRK